MVMEMLPGENLKFIFNERFINLDDKYFTL